MEVKSPFEREVNCAREHLTKVQSELAVVESLILQKNIVCAYDAAFQYAYEAEKLALHARVVPAFTGNPLAKVIMDTQTQDVLKISFGFTAQGWFCIKIPALLPKKEKGNAHYVRLNLYLALSEYFKTHERFTLKETVIIFEHHYDKSRPERRLRDHDNIEINTVVDAVALYVLRDDAPLLCPHYYCSVMDECDATFVYLVPRGQFAEWLLYADNQPEMLELVK